ncbi:hypothetical protein TKK_0016133 [Trichogramma kaykai]
MGRLKWANLTVRPDKCHFLKTTVTYLGHIISITLNPIQVKYQRFPIFRDRKTISGPGRILPQIRKGFRENRETPYGPVESGYPLGLDECTGGGIRRDKTNIELDTLTAIPGFESPLHRNHRCIKFGDRWYFNPREDRQ